MEVFGMEQELQELRVAVAALILHYHSFKAGLTD